MAEYLFSAKVRCSVALLPKSTSSHYQVVMESGVDMMFNLPDTM